MDKLNKNNMYKLGVLRHICYPLLGKKEEDFEFEGSYSCCEMYHKVLVFIL